jgi:hypothetical protein
MEGRRIIFLNFFHTPFQTWGPGLLKAGIVLGRTDQYWGRPDLYGGMDWRGDLTGLTYTEAYAEG